MATTTHQCDDVMVTLIAMAWREAHGKGCAFGIALEGIPLPSRKPLRHIEEQTAPSTLPHKPVFSKQVIFVALASLDAWPVTSSVRRNRELKRLWPINHGPSA